MKPTKAYLTELINNELINHYGNVDTDFLELITCIESLNPGENEFTAKIEIPESNENLIFISNRHNNSLYSLILETPKQEKALITGYENEIINSCINQPESINQLMNELLNTQLSKPLIKKINHSKIEWDIYVFDTCGIPLIPFLKSDNVKITGNYLSYINGFIQSKLNTPLSQELINCDTEMKYIDFIGLRITMLNLLAHNYCSEGLLNHEYLIKNLQRSNKTLFIDSLKAEDEVYTIMLETSTPQGNERETLTRIKNELSNYSIREQLSQTILAGIDIIVAQAFNILP